MQSIDVLAGYLASAAWLASSAYRREANAIRASLIVGLTIGAVAVALHAVLLGEAVFAGPGFDFSVGDTASLIGWPIGLIALLLTLARPRFATISASLVTIAGVVAASADGWEIAAHIALSTLAYALLTVAVVLAVAMALLDRHLRSRHSLGKAAAALPSMEALESATFQALSAGFAVLTLALLTGFIFVHDLFAQHLVHKTVLSCLAWVIFAVVLFGRSRFGWRGRVARSWTLSGFALLGLAYFGSKIVLENFLGRHWG